MQYSFHLFYAMVSVFADFPIDDYNFRPGIKIQYIAGIQAHIRVLPLLQGADPVCYAAVLRRIDG